jgi:DNA-binding NtrC family response regulator
MQSPDASHPYSRFHILIAAPNKTGTKARRTVLEEKGYTVAVASKSKDAMEWMAQEQTSLLIVDFSFDHSRGLAFLDEVRAAFPEIPTVLLADPLQEIEADTGNCCVDILVPKQFDEIPQLIRAVEKLQRRRKPRKQPKSIRATAKTTKKTG